MSRLLIERALSAQAVIPSVERGIFDAHTLNELQREQRASWGRGFMGGQKSKA